MGREVRSKTKLAQPLPPSTPSAADLRPPWQLQLAASRAPTLSKQTVHTQSRHTCYMRVFPKQAFLKYKKKKPKPKQKKYTQPWLCRYPGSFSGSQGNGNAMEQVSDTGEGATRGSQHRKGGVGYSSVPPGHSIKH